MAKLAINQGIEVSPQMELWFISVHLYSLDRNNKSHLKVLYSQRQFRSLQLYSNQIQFIVIHLIQLTPIKSRFEVVLMSSRPTLVYSERRWEWSAVLMTDWHGGGQSLSVNAFLWSRRFAECFENGVGHMLWSHLNQTKVKDLNIFSASLRDAAFSFRWIYRRVWPSRRRAMPRWVFNASQGIF